VFEAVEPLDERDAYDRRETWLSLSELLASLGILGAKLRLSLKPLNTIVL